jgi:hypothetical protein
MNLFWRFWYKLFPPKRKDVSPDVNDILNQIYYGTGPVVLNYTDESNYYDY